MRGGRAGDGVGGVRVCARAFVRAGQRAFYEGARVRAFVRARRFDLVTSIPFSYIDLYLYEVRVAPQLTQ